MKKLSVLSAMRPTGRLHLGHYFGTLQKWVELQAENKCYYMSADWHALTTDYADTSKIDENTLEMVADWIAVGIDPNKSVLFKQSKVTQHSELFLILSMIVPLGWLLRCPTYKEQKTEVKGKDLNNYGFLGYPVLQSADILLYKADIVPIGEDQLSHLEFAREVARRFNSFYGCSVLVVPKEKLTKVPKVFGLDGRKMSKSYDNSILIGESNDVLNYKIKNMFTDPLKIKKYDVGHPNGCVVFAFHKIFNENCKEKEEKCVSGDMGCILCKKQLMEILSEFMRPLSEKRQNLISDKTYLKKIIEIGSLEAAEVAQKTMKDIRQLLKF